MGNKKLTKIRSKVNQGELFIKEELLEKLARTGATIEEIADTLGVSTKALERHKHAIQRARAKLATTLRERQIEKAMQGSDQMLIWLGKQYLGQSDKTDTAVVGVNVQVVSYK
jgi:hypothetical protein